MRPLHGMFLLIALSFLVLSGCVRRDLSSPVGPEPTPRTTQLTANHEVFEANPIYSPDGAWVLFESDLTGNRDLWIMPASGGQAR